jgi:hypothetical protein
MFVRNVTEKDIGPISFEGFEFTIPPGVNAIHTPAGMYFTTALFKVEGAPIKNLDGTQTLTGAPLPPLIPATREEWDGKHYTTVTRFKIDFSRIPTRSDLIKLADKRGVDPETLQQFRDNEEIENETIVDAINQLPVPEVIRLPEDPDIHNATTDTSRDAPQRQGNHRR